MTNGRNTPVVREAVADDVAAVCALVTELGYPTSETDMAERMRAFRGAGEIALLAWVGSEALGLITLHMTPVLHRPTAVGRITALVVASAARGTGVGRALVREAERRLAASGCALVEVTSNQRRLDAHAFYERLGYERTSVRFKRSLDGPDSPSSH